MRSVLVGCLGFVGGLTTSTWSSVAACRARSPPEVAIIVPPRAIPAADATLAVMPRPRDDMSQIRRRGSSLQVAVLAGRDPITGERLYLSDSTTGLGQAKKICA
jgi:hypothetical protein